MEKRRKRALIAATIITIMGYAINELTRTNLKDNIVVFAKEDGLYEAISKVKVVDYTVQLREFNSQNLISEQSRTQVVLPTDSLYNYFILPCNTKGPGIIERAFDSVSQLIK